MAGIQTSEDPVEPTIVVPSTGLALPSQIGSYKILSVLGEGGMGAVVLEAERFDEEPSAEKRRVALKYYCPDRRLTHEMRRRFLRGARAIERVVHPGIVRVLEIGDHQGRPYFVMELVIGRTLAEILNQEVRIPPHRALEMVLHTARGLRAAHQCGVTHRDIKPSNILVDAEGGAKISDFGVASIEEQEPVFLLADMIVGTPDYMSPEMCHAQRGDVRSDIYSLGVTFYEILGGRPPFHGPPVDLMYKHLHRSPKRIVRRVPTLHPRIGRIVMKMLAKDPAKRYQNYDELIADLEDVQRRGHFTTRSRRWPGALTLIALGITLGLLVGLWATGYLPLAEETDPVETPTPQKKVVLPTTGFEDSVLPAITEEITTSWRVIATGALAAEPEKLVTLALDERDPAEGAASLRMEIVNEAGVPATEDLDYVTPWGLTVRVADVKSLESVPLIFSFHARGEGKEPNLIVRIVENPPRDTPFPSTRLVLNSQWRKHELPFTVEPSRAADHTFSIRIFIAGATGDTIWLDSLTVARVPE